MKKLLVGPYVGEFGWELFCWQAYVRKLSKQYDSTVIISRSNRKYLYEDFCNRFYGFDIEEETASCHGNEHRAAVECEVDTETTWLRPSNNLIFYNIKTGPIQQFFNDQHFVSYGKRCKKRRVVLLHARAMEKASERNWNIDKWKELVSMFTNVRFVSIGSKTGAYYIDGTVDRRDIELKELADLIRSCLFVIGPSSGPLHFASLCECSQLVWSGDDNNRRRYEVDWNPFKTRIEYLSTWNPEVSDVALSVLNMLQTMVGVR